MSVSVMNNNANTGNNINGQYVDEEHAQPFYVRALFDFQGSDASSLSFQRGDVIEVLNMLQSGWWDGLLDDERGWFPSNYVEPITETEAEQIFTLQAQQQQLQNVGGGGYDSQAAAMEAQRAPQQQAREREAGYYQQQQQQQRQLSMQQQSQQRSYPQQQLRAGAPGGGRYQDEEWSEDDPHHPQDHRTAASGQPSDFWVPQATSDGQIFYVNTITGAQSRFLPTEADDPHRHDDPIAAVSTVSSNVIPGRQRSATSASTSSSRGGANTPGFGLIHRSGTPEPWTKRLADDGMSYYYVNTQTGQTRWTPPSPRSFGNRTGNATAAGIDGFGGRPRTDSEASQRYHGASYHQNGHSASHSQTLGRRISIISDGSGIDPYSIDNRPPSPGSGGVGGGAIRPLPRQPPGPGDEEFAGTEGLADPLQVASVLKKEMTPPPLPAITTYSQAAKEAISAVVDSFTERASMEQSRQNPTSPQANELSSRSAAMANKVTLVVVAVRNLLYVSGTLTGALANLASPTPNSTMMGDDMDWVRSQIKPFQRKVTATLSKLVLSARALNANPDWPSNNVTSTGRVESDAAELERAVTNFVTEIQRTAASSRAKRLQGVLLPSASNDDSGVPGVGLGVGIIGAGAAGRWKGSGFVSLSERIVPPQRRLGREVVSELSNLRLQAEDRITSLSTAVMQYKNALDGILVGTSNNARIGDKVILSGRLAIAHLSDFLALAEDVDVAGYVDVFGIDFEQDVAMDPGEQVKIGYSDSLLKARELIRLFETARQALYDDSAVLLMASQAVHVSLLSSPASVSAPGATTSGGPPEVVQAAISALRENLGTLMETLENLLDVAQSQSEVRALVVHRAPSSLQHQTPYAETRASLLPVDPNDPTSNWHAAHAQLEQPDEDYNGSLANVNGYVNMQYAMGGPGPSSGALPLYGAPLEPPIEQTIQLPPQPAGAPPSIPSSATSTRVEDNFSSQEVGEDEDLEDPDVVEAKTAKANKQASKVARVLGDVPNHFLQTKAQEVMPWYLRPDFSQPSEIQTTPSGEVRAATLPALIERLTMHDSQDAKFNDTFLMTFKSFSTIDEVFDMLVARFNIQPPEGLNPEQLEKWRTFKRAPIRLRAINTIRKMLDGLEKEDQHILARVKAFANDIVANSPDMAAAAKSTLTIVQRVENGVRPMQPTIPEFPPPSILPRRQGRIKLLDIDALELARQLTIMESELFFKIKQNDCIARAKESVPAAQDSIKSVITTANKIADWVADSVLSRDDARRRAAVIKHFITVAERCRGLKNYSTMAALIAGLNSPPIRRLKRTWEQVATRHTAALDDLEKTLDTPHNFTAYKALLANQQPPCVPFLGVYLTTLTFIQDGNKDMKDGGLINFQKRQKMADVIQEITKFQGQPYNLTRIQPIRGFIDECLAGLENAPDFWQLSLEREPREREDEKMARLLQESGFL